MGWNRHHVQVNLEQGKANTKRNWKRPKQVFFNSRPNPNTAGERAMDQVSTLCCVMVGRGCVDVDLCSICS
jgi:hypothetical protein